VFADCYCLIWKFIHLLCLNSKLEEIRSSRLRSLNHQLFSYDHGGRGGGSTLILDTFFEAQEAFHERLFCKQSEQNEDVISY